MENEREATAVHKPSKGNDLRMRLFADVNRSDKEWLGQSFRIEVKIADAYVKFKEELSEIFSQF